jgi:hypothetical protein
MGPRPFAYVMESGSEAVNVTKVKLMSLLITYQVHVFEVEN